MQELEYRVEIDVPLASDPTMHKKYICAEMPSKGEMRLLGIGQIERKMSDSKVVSIGDVEVTLDASGNLNGVFDPDNPNPRKMISELIVEGSICFVYVNSTLLFSGTLEGPMVYRDEDLTVTFTISVEPKSDTLGFSGGFVR